MTTESGDKTYYGIDNLANSDRRKSHWPDWPEYIYPFPYYPTLRRILRSSGAAAVLVYFETFHSIDTQVDLSVVRRALQITKRNWWWVASAITTMHYTPANRRIAQLAHREFIRDGKGISGLVTPYSLTAVNSGRQVWELRRNQTVLNNLLQSARLTADQIRADAAKLKPSKRKSPDVKVGKRGKGVILGATAFDHANKLSDVIEKALAKKAQR